MLCEWNGAVQVRYAQGTACVSILRHAESGAKKSSLTSQRPDGPPMADPTPSIRMAPPDGAGNPIPERFLLGLAPKKPAPLAPARASLSRGFFSAQLRPARGIFWPLEFRERERDSLFILLFEFIELSSRKDDSSDTHPNHSFAAKSCMSLLRSTLVSVLNK